MEKSGNLSADPRGVESTHAEQSDKSHVRQQRFEELLTKLILGRRASDWRAACKMEDGTQVESRGNTEEESPCSWEGMPKVAKDFISDVPGKKSLPEEHPGDDWSGSLDPDGVPVF